VADELYDFDSKISKMYKKQLSELEAQLESQAWISAADAVRKLKFVSKLKNEIERVEDHLLN
jgi:molecular chaperone HscB